MDVGYNTNLFLQLTRTQVPAGPKFLDWLQDECPGAAEHLPVEDKKFKKIRVTRFLLEDASEEFKSLLLEVFCFSVSNLK